MDDARFDDLARGLDIRLSRRHAGGLAAGALLALGRGSLRVYALHLPFAYGRLGLRVRAVPDMSVLSATPWVLGLMLLTYGLLRGSDTLRDRWRAWRYTRPAT